MSYCLTETSPLRFAGWLRFAILLTLCAFALAACGPPRGGPQIFEVPGGAQDKDSFIDPHVIESRRIELQTCADNGDVGVDCERWARFAPGSEAIRRACGQVQPGSAWPRACTRAGVDPKPVASAKQVSKLPPANFRCELSPTRPDGSVGEGCRFVPEDVVADGYKLLRICEAEGRDFESCRKYVYVTSDVDGSKWRLVLHEGEIWLQEFVFTS